MSLRIGEKAPEFEVVSASGRTLALSAFRGKKNVVLYFYPADFTPVCTKETCGFRDAHEDLATQNTEVIGVSVDSDASHRKFAEKYDVPFELVADENRALATRYDTVGLFRKLLGRVDRITYVIDKNGLIAGVFDSPLRASSHVDGVRNLVTALEARREA